ncbi:MAG: energy-coupling factor ABC transporter permease [Firmicutes bacterium]|nr:energy-coupling factor ABC transporter permease [Bacillota bacterium]
MGYSKAERSVLTVLCVLALVLFLSRPAGAMHIMEGYLPPQYCVAWGVVCLPFLVLGVMSLRRTLKENRRLLILLAMSGAFIFVISSLKIPTFFGSSSHMTGTGLAAILFGVTSTSILGMIVLIFQAVMLAHGGITTLGANTFSMAIAGPMVAWFLFKAGNKLKVNRMVTIFIAAMFGDLFTYCVTSVQLALAYPSQVGGVAASAIKFLAVYAPTQVPLAIVEGILTVLIIMGLESISSGELAGLSSPKSAEPSADISFKKGKMEGENDESNN